LTKDNLENPIRIFTVISVTLSSNTGAM